jgi:Ca-activated chloride channel family protein
MSSLTARSSLLLVTAILAACAGQHEAEEVAKEKQHQDDLSEIVVTGSRVEPAASGKVARNEAKRADAPAQQIAMEQYAPAQAVDLARVRSMPFAPPPYVQDVNTERYEHLNDNAVHLVSEQPVSTFSIDVDTGAYANVRRFLNAGQLPPQDAVRVEEMINYFDYDYAPPSDRKTPFKVSTELANAPWNHDALLLKIGIKGFEVAAAERPAANLVFLIDVSGSMQTPDKLPLLKNAFRLLTDQLSERDRVAMVVYAGSTGVVLEPTSGKDKYKILAALDRLEAGGSTNGGAGIEQAYALARSMMIPNGINRVVLATDGDFNVGVVNFEALIDRAERERSSGIALTTLGFGTGNYNDQLLERLADAGNGNYAYVDNLSEARKVLVSELSSTLFTIAKDVKIQVEFNPAEVQEYRLIGYENRMLAREDFSNDKVDAGEIGAGHRVTALYEVIPAGKKGHVEPLRYGESAGAKAATASTAGELAHVRLRYKQPSSDSSQLLEYPINVKSAVTLAKASDDFRFAASVAAFGQLLRGGKYVEGFGYQDIVSLAKGGLSKDDEGYRREFVSLVKLADSLQPQPQAQKLSEARN